MNWHRWFRPKFLCILAACVTAWGSAKSPADEAAAQPSATNSAAAASQPMTTLPDLRLPNFRLPDFRLPNARGREWTQNDLASGGIVVFAVLGTECPLAKLYAGRLQNILAEMRSRTDGAVDVIALFPNRQDSLSDIAAMGLGSQIDYPMLKDPAGEFSRQLGATRTPEVFVFGADRTLKYRGRIDDQYGIGYVRDAPEKTELRNVLRDLIAGRSVTTSPTDAIGCLIGYPKNAATDGSGADVGTEAPVNYVDHIADLLDRRCVGCHREGEIGPFAMNDYDEVVGWADMMLETIQDGRMPPWHASPDHGRFANERRLSDDEKDLFARWVDSGAPRGLGIAGKSRHADKRPDWVSGEEPDLIVPITDDPVEIQAEGVVRYRYFVVDPGLTEDTWFTHAEIRVGNRRVVHHVLGFASPPDAKGLDRFAGGVGGYLVGYVPGTREIRPPAGYAKRIPAGSKLVFQMHYTPTGSPETDQSELGLYLIDADEVTHEVHTASAAQLHLRIPPHDDRYTTYSASNPLPEGAELLSMSPHMHVRGSAYRYELERVDGSTETLLDIPYYDFNWQTTYQLAEPIRVAAGERIVGTAVFDNSRNNLANPDPSATVSWGDQTFDEMMIGYFHYALPRSSGDSTDQDSMRSAVASRVRMRQYDRIDRDNDGRITRQETPRALRGVFDRMNGDGDRVLTRREVALFRQ